MALAARGPFQNVPIIFLKRLKSQSFVLRIIRVLAPILNLPFHLVLLISIRNSFLFTNTLYIYLLSFSHSSVHMECTEAAVRSQRSDSFDDDGAKGNRWISARRSNSS